MRRNSRHNVSIKKNKKKYISEISMKKYIVPSNIRKIAANAIDVNLARPMSQRAAMKREGDKVTFGTGMRTARRLVSGSIDRDQMILMRAWFARHGASDKEAKARQDKTSKAAISWALWGGSPSRRFVKAKLRQLERKDNE